jgi:Protein of unknown function (DUF3011)
LLKFALLTLMLSGTLFGGSARAQDYRSVDLPCSSGDERWQQCATPFTQIRNVELERQYNGSPCVEGRTWGNDATTIWVDRGCRADFKVWTRR